MTSVGGAVRGAGWLGGVLALATLAHAAGEPAEVRVLSTPGATTVRIRARPDTTIEDRTAGAAPAGAPRGPASAGATFSDEVTLFLRDVSVPRAAAIDVADPVVSVVRLFPEAGGTLVTIFVRKPVTYTVSRPSGIGEIAVVLEARARPGASPARGARRPATPSEDEVAVDAESLSFDQQTNTLTARGGVTLTSGDTTLTCDELLYDRTNGVVEARGNVVLVDAQGQVEGDFAHLDLEAETGWVDRADAHLEEGNYFLKAGRLEKQSGPRYRVAEGVFTTCECGGLEKPSWSLAGRQTDVKLGGAGVARGVSFRVKDVPVLWTPYLVFPVNTQRQSGFLIPRVGYSNQRGFQYEQPFYWAINKTSDATVALDVETSARIGVIGEYRYALSRQTRGGFVAAYFNERFRGRSEGVLEPDGTPADDIPENRWAVAGHHRQTLPGRSKGYVDLFLVGDDQFLREIDTFSFYDLALRTTRYTTSRAGVYRGWERGFAWLEGAYFQDLIDPQELALARLPRLEAEHAVPLLGNRLIGRLAGQAVYYERSEGFEGVRSLVGPELFLPFHLGQVLNGSVTGSVREQSYHLTEREQVGFVVPDPGVNVAPNFRTAPDLPELDSNRFRGVAQVSARTGTELARVFDFRHLGLDRLRHTVEPEVRYLFVPEVSRPESQLALPPCRAALGPEDRPGITCSGTLFAEGYLFDDYDAINRRNFFSYGVTTRLLGRPAAAAEAPPPAAAAPDEGEPAEDAEPEADEAEAAADDPAGAPFAPDGIAQGLPAAALPQFVGPPAPRGRKPATPPVRELARASILAGYDVRRDLVGDSHHSDLDLALRVTPTEWLGASYTSTVSATQGQLRGLAAGLVVREPWRSSIPAQRGLQGPSALGVSYRFVEKGVNEATARTPAEELLFSSQGFNQGINEIDGSVYLRLGDYVGFTFLARYDLSTTRQPTGEIFGPHFLERDYLVRLISRCNCWVLEAGLADKTNPDERLFRIQFTLIGLGSFGQGPGLRNYVGLAPLAGYDRRSGPSPSGAY